MISGFISITYYSFTISLSALPALNLGAVEAGISIFSPVWWFYPTLAALSVVSNVPNPTI